MKNILLIVCIILSTQISAQTGKQIFPTKDSTNQYYEGRKAYFHSINILKNPYSGKDSTEWVKGYNSGKLESESWK